MRAALHVEIGQLSCLRRGIGEVQAGAYCLVTERMGLGDLELYLKRCRTGQAGWRITHAQMCGLALQVSTGNRIDKERNEVHYSQMGETG